jgi:hypothetical protein
MWNLQHLAIPERGGAVRKWIVLHRRHRGQAKRNRRATVDFTLRDYGNFAASLAEICMAISL